MRNIILCGDALSVLATLPDQIAQCCVTSPPYFGLRDYGVAGQIGLESDLQTYLTCLVAVFGEVRRVLRPDGVLWLNMGDSYVEHTRANRGQAHRVSGLLPKPKNLLGIPWRLALALQDDGWWLRSDCIWAKPNPLPEPVRDRPARAHEYVFLLAKSPRYFYDVEATRQPLRPKTASTWGSAVARPADETLDKVKSANWARTVRMRLPRLNADGSLAGAPLRSVWTVAGTHHRGAHFAVFPPRLIEPCILAGSSPYACEHCHTPWTRIIGHAPARIDRNAETGTEYADEESSNSSYTTGWRPTCACDNAGTGRCLVLDPFMGTGTTALVARQLGRDYLGIEINPEYIRLAEQRLAAEQEREGSTLARR